MPVCLEIVTALRRLNSIDLERLQSSSKSSSTTSGGGDNNSNNIERVFAAMELSLQVDFLEARDTWLDQPTNTSATSTTGNNNNNNLSSRNSTSTKISSHQHSSSSEQLLDTIERYRTR
jgi:hypothetical protein